MIQQGNEQPDFVRRPRVLLVFDGTAWFVRRLETIEYDLDRDMKIYHCSAHLGGPFSLDEGCEFLKLLRDDPERPHRSSALL